MNTLIKTFLLVLFFSTSFNSFAQNDGPQTYYVFGYMKVKPGKQDAYLKLEKAWKKIHEANINAGKAESWTLTKVVSPVGAQTEYNYITRTRLVGKKQLADYMAGNYMTSNWKDMLSMDEIELVMNTSKIRTFVKEEVWYAVERVLAEKMDEATVSVFNYFDQPEGISRQDQITAELGMWKPLHQAQLNDGNRMGWVVAGKRFPYGANEEYHLATVDIFKDMEQFMNEPGMKKYVEKVHPGKSMDDIMKKTREVSTLVKGEVRLKVDSVSKQPKS